MEWISAIRKSVEYIEEHLKDKIVAQDVAESYRKNALQNIIPELTEKKYMS